MPLVVNTNVMSLTSQRYLGVNTTALGKSMEKLSSGYRINRAADDAAGLQLSENLRAQIRGSQKALGNVQDAINMLNIADGAYGQLQENYQRVRELLVQAGNDTYDQTQRDAMQAEMTELLRDNDRITEATSFNGISLLNEEFNIQFPPGAGFQVQLGPNNAAEDRLDINANNILGDKDVNNVGFIEWNEITGTGPAIISAAAASLWMTRIDASMDVLNSNRGRLGATVNRLEGAANNLLINIENLSASESRIRNVDVAAETATLSRNQILQQASASMLAQANQAPALALKLLGG